jgi:hypothetical protein
MMKPRAELANVTVKNDVKVCRGFCKGSFFPRLGEYRTRNVEKAKQPPSASAAFEAFGCRCLVFLVLAPACAALRFGLLLSALSRLNHILFPEHPSGRL